MVSAAMISLNLARPVHRVGYIEGAGKSAAPELLFCSALPVVAFLVTHFICINGQADEDWAHTVARQSI